MGCDTMQLGGQATTFRRNLLPPSSEWNVKTQSEVSTQLAEVWSHLSVKMSVRDELDEQRDRTACLLVGVT
jgi:hypothetical protein